MHYRKIVLALLFAGSYLFSAAQIEVGHLSTKNFSGIAFGGFFNVSVPISDADYVSGEAALYVASGSEKHIALLPLLASYRYTLDRTGTGWYVEPNAGWSFGASDIKKYDQYDNPIYVNGKQAEQKVTGPTTGLGFGYLFEPSGIIQFNIGLRYEHVFSEYGQNLFSLRISHAFTFGRRE